MSNIFAAIIALSVGSAEPNPLYFEKAKSQLRLAGNVYDHDPEMAIVRCGKAMEWLLKGLFGYGIDDIVQLGDMIEKYKKDERIERYTSALRYISDLRNLGAHAKKYDATKEEAENVISMAGHILNSLV